MASRFALLGLVALCVACSADDAPASGGSGGETETSDGATTSTTTTTTTTTTAGSTSGSSATSTTGPMPGACDPGDLELEPPCEAAVGRLAIEEPGCYQPCEDASECDSGGCVLVSGLPCEADAPGCTECGGLHRICVEAPPVAPTFPDGLNNQAGCFRSVMATDDADNIGLEVRAFAAAMESMESGEVVTATITLPSDDADVVVYNGYSVGGSWCTDAPLGTIIDTYTATAGTVDVTVEPGPGDGSSIVGAMTASIRGVTVATEDGRTLEVGDFDFETQELWCCPG